MRENGYLNGINVCPHYSLFIIHYSLFIKHEGHEKDIKKRILSCFLCLSRSKIIRGELTDAFVKCKVNA
jgi:hypothetical protein